MEKGSLQEQVASLRTTQATTKMCSLRKRSRTRKTHPKGPTSPRIKTKGTRRGQVGPKRWRKTMKNTSPHTW